jgi:hypothetical protein
MKNLILFCLLLMGTSASQAAKEQKNADIRDLIILLDTDVETTIEWGGAALSELNTALYQQNAPILVSAPLWNTFVEGMQEYKGQRAIPNSNDAILATLVDAINTRINYWYRLLSEHNKDAVHAKMLTIECINTEFYTKEAYKKLQDEKRIVAQKEAKRTFLAYSCCANTFFNPDEWYSSVIDSAYYLLIPKSYVKKYTSSTNFYEVIQTLFAPPAPLDMCVDPLNTAWLLHAEPSATSATIIPALTKIFTASITTQERPLWCIYMAGHGSTSQSDFQNSSIADMTWEAYQNVCSFFDTYVSMHSLWIISCKAGGHNRLALFDDDTHQYRYQYPIIIESLNDSSASSGWLLWTHLPDGESFLSSGDIFWNANTAQWHLQDRLGTNFKKFFKHLHQLDLQKNSKKKSFSYNVMLEVAQRLRSNFDLDIRNTPQLFLPGIDASHICYPESAHRIDVHSVILAQLCNQPIVVRKPYLFIDVPSIIQPLYIVGTMPNYVISTAPGSTTHYFAILNAPKVYIDRIAYSFWQLQGSACNKLFLIDTINCIVDPKNPLAHAIGATEESLTVTNVMLYVIKNEQIRIVFTNPAGTTFSAQMRKLSYDTPPVLRNLQPLSADSAGIFAAWYQKEKTKCVDNAQVAYAKLHDLYAKALNIQPVVQESVSDDVTTVADAQAKNPETHNVPTDVQLG